MKLNGLLVRADACHDEVRFRNHLLARDTCLVIPYSATDAREAIVRQASVGKLGTDKSAETIWNKHELPFGDAQNKQRQIHPRIRAA